MESLSSDILGHIFERIESPFDLLQVAAVCKTFYLIARADRCWLSHKQRILQYIPLLEPLFDKHKNKLKLSNGKRIKLKKKKAAWRMPKGIWFVFAKHLMFRNISHVLKRNSGNTYVIPAICLMAFNNRCTVVRRTHPNPLLNLHFNCCLQMPSFIFFWIAIQKGDPSTVSVYSDVGLLFKLNVDGLLYNFKRLIHNELSLLKSVSIIG